VRRARRSSRPATTPGAIEEFKKAFEASRELRRQYPDEPAYSENAYYYLSRLATSFGKTGNIPQAAEMAEPAARGYAEIATSNPSAENKENAANALGVLAWYQMLANKGTAAEASARQALQFTPDSTMVNINLAHALLLNGKRAEAEAIYKAMRPLKGADGRSLRDVILEDFDAMEAAGLNTPAIGELRETLGGAKSTGARRNTKAKAKSDGPVWPFILGVALLIGAIFAVLMYLERKRTAAMEAAAKALGLTLRAKALPADQALVQGSALATVGRSRALRNVIELPEADGMRMTLFDYSYVIGHGKQSRTYNQTVTRVESAKLNLPAFDMRPEGHFREARADPRRERYRYRWLADFQQTLPAPRAGYARDPAAVYAAGPAIL
jgi:tetratricopeptide (TPR) repeat protein